MKITRILVVALAFVGAFTLAQDPGFQLSPPPAVVAPTPAPAFQVPVIITNPAPAAVPDATWQWIVTYVAVPLLIALSGLAIAWINGLKGRLDRQAVKTGQLSDQIVGVATATTPPPAAVPGTPSSPPRVPPAVILCLAAVVALGLGACANFPAIRGNFAYTDAAGRHYAYVTNSDGSRTLTLADTKGNTIGLTSDGKEVLVDLNLQSLKGAAGK